ncbi:MAG: hypothetical protein Q9172_005904 [Xanthocarpia lactea]
MSRISQSLEDLESENVVLISQKRFLLQDLEDTTLATSDAYIAELEYAFASASAYGAQSLKQPRTERKLFKVDVATYLDSKKPHTMAFDNGPIAIVPHGSIDQNPTEWKVVVLQNDLLNKVIYQDPYNDEETKWKDLDGKKLQWKNNNRPARRYLYMRYALTWLAARRAGYVGWEAKVPPGTMWASPGKPGGYLRNSILRVLASKIGDKAPLPQDVILAGGFDEPQSHSVVKDQAGALTLSVLVRDHVEGKLRDKKEEEEEEEFDEAVAEEMMGLAPGQAMTIPQPLYLLTDDTDSRF